MSIDASWIHAGTFPGLRRRRQARSLSDAASGRNDLPNPHPRRSPAAPPPSFEVYVDLVRPYDPRPFLVRPLWRDGGVDDAEPFL
jgi:hypothetical protein